MTMLSRSAIFIPQVLRSTFVGRHTSPTRNRGLPIMKTALLLFALGICTPWQVASAQQLRASCTYAKGERLFKGSQTVALERTGSRVVVRSAARPTDDYWTYKVVFEAPDLGWFRAIRAGETESQMDVLLAGELVYLIDSGQPRIEVTTLNASSGSAASSTMSCK